MITGVEINIRLPKVIMQGGYFNSRFEALFQASNFIAEDKYVEEAPVNSGDFKGGIKTRKGGSLEYRIISTATNKGHNYPLDLFTGTGRFRGAPDFGYTTGRVRAGTVLFGIGGIRPNKVADRARAKANKPVVAYINKGIANLIKE